MNREAAETVALKALDWLLGEDDLRGVFLGATGLDARDMGALAADGELLGAVLDFVTQDDEWVLAFCSAAGLAPTDPMTARAALPGGAQMNWT